MTTEIALLGAGAGAAVGAGIVTKKGLDAVFGLLSKVCGPSAEQVGLLLADRVQEWRAKNLINSVKRLERFMNESKMSEGCHAHPRIANSIVQEMTWIDDGNVQEMWAGLLASSCTDAGDDDSNLIFVTLLGNMTKLQARIVNFACEKCRKYVSSAGLIQTDILVVKFAAFCEAVGENDVARLDRELDSLRSVGLITMPGGGFNPLRLEQVDVTPTPLALHMFVRAKGSRLPPQDYFGLETPPVAKQPATQP